MLALVFAVAALGCTVQSSPGYFPVPMDEVVGSDSANRSLPDQPQPEESEGEPRAVSPPHAHDGDDEAQAFMYASPCNEPSVRMAEGALSKGPLVVRIRAMVAHSGTGQAAASNAQIDAALAMLNEAYAGGNISFVLNAREDLEPKSAWYDLVWKSKAYEEMWHVRMPSIGNAVPVLMSNTISDDAAGLGGYFGVFINMSEGHDRMVYAQEIGHFLGLSHTFSCKVAGSDGISDTPHDPGLVAHKPNIVAEECSSEKSGLCKQDKKTCTVTCSDGSSPDGRNYMSYYANSCGDHFSQEQLMHVRCVLRMQRPGLLANATAELLCKDTDGDKAYAPTATCLQTKPEGPFDCDDKNPAAYPGAAEVCNGFDDDCDKSVDELPQQLCNDGDGCTVDTCYGTSGCGHSPKTCPKGSVCLGGTCIQGTQCSAGKVCKSGTVCCGSGDNAFCVPEGSDCCADKGINDKACAPGAVCVAEGCCPSTFPKQCGDASFICCPGNTTCATSGGKPACAAPGAVVCGGVLCQTGESCCQASGKSTCMPAGATCCTSGPSTYCSKGSTCTSSGCKTDPCAGISCSSPPPSKCLNTTTLRTYSSPGTCSSGQCSYSYQDATIGTATVNDSHCGGCGKACTGTTKCQTKPCPGTCKPTAACCGPEKKSCSGMTPPYPCPAGTSWLLSSSVGKPCNYVCCSGG